MGLLQNYLGLKPADKDGYDLPLPGADGFRSGHQDTHFGITQYSKHAQTSGARGRPMRSRRMTCAVQGLWSEQGANPLRLAWKPPRSYAVSE